MTFENLELKDLERLHEFWAGRKLNTKLDTTDALSMLDHLGPLYYNLSRNTQTHLCEDYISAFELFTNKKIYKVSILKAM